MKSTLLNFFCLFFGVAMVNAQDLVEVTEQTIKLGAHHEEMLYFGFAAGDKIIFDFHEIHEKELKEIEILEYPSNARFSDFKTAKIDQKIIAVAQNGVFVFRFKNGAMTARICKIKIQRQPASEQTKNFNSTITWETRQETTYHTYTKDIIVGYDTIYTQKTKKELVKSEQREELICDKPQRVHSITNSHGNKTSLFFSLPPNEISTYKNVKVVAWAYWVGVGEEAQQAWKQNIQLIGNVAKGVAAYFTSPLGALAIGAIADLAVPKIGEDVYYGIADQTNKDLFFAGQAYRIYDQGTGVAGFRKFTDPTLCQGTFHILLSNDNQFVGIDANVKVVAIVETSIYEDKQYTEMHVNPRYEKKTFSDPIINTHQVPVIGQP